ncbi:hypothetical protein ACU8DI_05185 [Psychroserpens sp. BH13MA-6]
MKDMNRYDELLKLLEVDGSNEFTANLEAEKTTINSEDAKRRYFELTDISKEEQAHFPDSFEVIASKNILITPENPFIIEDKNTPVAYHFDTMTFQDGGQIICYASALITVETLIK